MGEQSGIEWTDATFNPWVGCTKVSPACDNCYAESWAERFGDVKWGNHARRRTSEKNWNNPRRWQRQADQFEREQGRPRFVFCASLADVFDNQVDPAWRDDLWALIKECDRLIWLLLTKRPQNIKKMLPNDWGGEYDHVWLGTTAENNKELHRRWLNLSGIRNPIKDIGWQGKTFLSMEPLVDEVDLAYYNGPIHVAAGDHLAAMRGIWFPHVNWVITGGESGPGARPADPDWYRKLRDQCAKAGIPFHFKQWGEYDADQKRVGKKSAGRLLDGETHDGRPHPHST